MTLALTKCARSVIAAAERGETIVITKNGTPVAKSAPQTVDRASDPEWRSAFARLKKSLRSKKASGYRIGAITEDDKYGDDEWPVSLLTAMF